MDHGREPGDPGARERVFETFYALAARDLMDASFDRAAFVPPHGPVEDLLELFLRVDHAWVMADPGDRGRLESVLLRRDLLRALEPTQASYSRFSKMRFRSLAHGSADCICRFTEGRVLHAVAPETRCREVLHLMESKGALYLPVLSGRTLVGEIGSVDLLRAIHRIYTAP